MGETHTYTVAAEDAANAAAAARPENVPEKFWDATAGAVNTEALLASYGELEKKLGAGADPKKPGAGDSILPSDANQEDPEGGSDGDDKTKDGAGSEDVAEAASIDLGAAEAHFAEHGEVPEDVYEKAAALGFDKDAVNEFVAYRVAQADRIRDELMTPLGGEEAVTKMMEWAGREWSEDKVNSFNEAFEGKDKGRMELVLKALKADFDKAHGVRPKLVQGASGQARGGAYTSVEQLLADQRDPRYATDPAYRAAVVAKLARSNI